MAERAVFLDRDGTIIEDTAYLGDPAKVKLLAGAAAALAALRALGYRLIVVSNQSGVARGMFDEAAVEAVNDEMSRQLKVQAAAYVDASYYCPYHPEAVVAAYRVDHEWRKPKPGMLRQAAADFGLDLSQSWMIGDMARDIAAGAAVGCRTILLKDVDIKKGGATAKVNGENGGTGAGEVSPNYVVRSLADAARIILREGRTLQAASVEAPAAAIAERAKGDAVDDVRGVDSRGENADLETKRPRAAETGAAPPAAVIGTVDQDHLAERVADRLAKSMPVWLSGGAAHAAATGGVAGTGGVGISPQVEKNLDELVVQLRAQNRNADLKEDFSLAHIGAMILQALVIVCLVFGLANHFTAPATFADATTVKGLSDQLFAQMAHDQSIFWAATGVAFQGMVIALLLHAREK